MGRGYTHMVFTEQNAPPQVLDTKPPTVCCNPEPSQNKLPQVLRSCYDAGKLAVIGGGGGGAGAARCCASIP
ncbi:unnamed protein product, partial [Symbiodinium sp. CCMP2592]